MKKQTEQRKLSIREYRELEKDVTFLQFLLYIRGAERHEAEVGRLRAKDLNLILKLIEIVDIKTNDLKPVKDYYTKQEGEDLKQLVLTIKQKDILESDELTIAFTKDYAIAYSYNGEPNEYSARTFEGKASGHNYHNVVQRRLFNELYTIINRELGFDF